MILRKCPDRSEIRVVPAEIEFDSELALNLGGVTARLIHVAGPHSEDAVVCYVPEDRFLYLGDSNGKDMFGTDWTFDIEYKEDLVPTLAKIPYDPVLLDPYYEKLSALDFDGCIGGHALPMNRQTLFALLGK